MRNFIVNSDVIAACGGFCGYFIPSVAEWFSDRPSVQSVVEAESQSILEVQIQLTDVLYVTPADCLQIISATVGLIGFCHMIYRKVKKMLQ